MTDPDSISKTELLEALKEAQEQIQHLESLIAEYKWLEGALRKRTFELSERVKELDCLYAISSRLANPQGSLQKFLADIVDIMPHGWQYPKSTCVRLKLNNYEYQTSNFIESRLKQTASIYKGNKRIGILEVRLIPSPIHDKYQPFLPQEKQLLDVIAIWISVIVKFFEHLLT
jgi:nitrate/nitrite-specific signal transduction histidine kinase